MATAYVQKDDQKQHADAAESVVVRFAGDSGEFKLLFRYEAHLRDLQPHSPGITAIESTSDASIEALLDIASRPVTDIDDYADLLVAHGASDTQDDACLIAVTLR